MIPGIQASTSGIGAFAGELADMQRRIGDLARSLGSIGAVTSYTPAYAFTGTPTITYTTQVGSFVRIGKLCVVQWVIDINTLSGVYTTVDVTLPFTAAATIFPPSGAWIDAGSAPKQQLVVVAGTAQARLRLQAGTELSSAGTPIALTGQNGSLVYITA